MNRKYHALATRHSSLATFLLLFFLALPASAQVQPGTPPFGSFGGGPDVINLGNLNGHLTIHAMNKPGRGTNFTYDLNYDSSVWYPVTSGGATTWHFLTGWTVASPPVMGYATYQTTGPHSCRFLQETQYITEYYYLYDNWIYTDSLGTAHAMIGAIQDGGAPDCGPSDVNTLTTNDGSGYKLSVPDQTLYNTGGAVGVLNGGTFTDRNGNKVTQSGTTFTDTLGTTALTVTGSGTPSSPKVLTFTPPNTSSSLCVATNTAGVACWVISYVAYTVKSNFGCTGVSEYPATVNNLVDKITLPDGSYYQFTYEATPGYSGDVTGRLASIRLPTGGTISYTYTAGGLTGSAVGSNDPIVCADGSAAGLTRQTPDGTWTYSRTQVSGNHWQTKVTTPPDPGNSPPTLGDDTVIDFQQDSAATYPTKSFYETQRVAYQGTVSENFVLRTTTICYNTNTTGCATTAVSSPITKRTVTDNLPGPNNLQCQHIYWYNSTGSLTQQADYDYGSGVVGSLLKQTTITMASLGNITKFRQTVTITNGSGATVSKTNYNYDETAVVATTGTPQHGAVYSSRGNLTSINYYTNGTTYLTKRMTYFDTGKVQTVTDLNGAQTTYTYGACGNSFPTSMSEPLSLSRSMTWNCTGGAQLTVTDENNQIATTAYSDPYFWRPASATDPTNATANLTYTGQTQAESSLSFNNGNSTSDMLGKRDGLGRSHLAQAKESPSGSNYDTVETDFDSFGRPSRVTLPYVGTAGQANSSAPAKTTTYDALNRVLQISDASGGYRSYTYSQNDVYITRGPAPSGENTKRRQEEFDALGRLTSVCEITSASGSGTCSQNSSQTGYWSKYSYDALARLTGVTQNAQSSSTQTRTYVYDLLGRLTSETNPENGTTTYVYDTDSTCGTSNGDSVKKTDAVGNVTCTAYDALHRPTAITYPSGSYASVTPAKHFVYDAATVNSVAMTNAKGRLAEAYTTGTMPFQNTNFEASSALPPPGWSANAATLSYDTTTQYAGARSLKTTATSLYGGAYSSFLPGVPGKTYSIAGYIKSDGTCIAYIQIRFLDVNGNYLDSAQTGGSTQTSWQFVTATNIAPANTVYTQLGLPNGNSTGAGVCEFDNISASSNAVGADEGFSYTARGEVSDVYESTPNSNGYYHVSAQYWANSALKQLSAPGIPTITYTTDGEGRPYQVSASSGQNPVTNTVFNAASLPTSVTYGSSDSDAFSYDSNTNRITQYQFTVNGQSLTGALTWNANHTLASQNITDPFNSADQQNCNYAHDDLTRLASVNCGSIFSQTFSYDAFGNISKSGTYSFQPTYNSATNRFSSIPGCSSLSYDSNGNVLNDCNHTYSMDSLGKPVTVDSVNLTYDALGRMVEQNRSGSYTQIVYSPGGAKLALMSGQTLQKGLVPLPGGGQAVYNSSGLLYYGHSEHLGSIKLGSTPSRSIYFDLAYAPFGETYAMSGSTDPAFTGQRQDTVGGLFDFPAREYSNQGRWPSPDPSGLGSVGLSDPQTLNRYAYVRNNPLTMVDPNGLCGGEDELPCSEGCPGQGCSAGGGSDDGSGNNPSNPDPSSGDPTNSGSDCGPFGPTCGGPIDDSGNPPVGITGDIPLADIISGSPDDYSSCQGGTCMNSSYLDETFLIDNPEELSGLLGLSFADQQIQAIAPTIAAANDLVEAAGWVEIGLAAGAGCAAMGGYPCGAALMTGVVTTDFLFGEQNQFGPTEHVHGEEPNGGYQGREPGSINGEPPVDILPNTIIFPIIIF